ncbi:MAG: hypothetical protein [Microvirus sp.]|nr:MAG: hypothetical protein [Microvirus sp.]
MRRHKMSRRGSRRNFTYHAGAHPKNNQPHPMRGGYRI